MSAKVSIRFTLPDDQYDYACAVHGPKAISALWELDTALRAQLKYAEHSAEVREILESLRALIPGDLLDL